MIRAVANNPKLIITEIADPNDSADARFVELYSSDSAGKTIGKATGDKDYYLIRWTNGNAAPTASSRVMLTGKALDANGFLVLCKNAATFKEKFSKDNCQQESASAVDSNGDDNIAIVTGNCDSDNICEWKDCDKDCTNIVDMFGVPGTDGSGEAHEFEDGRAERKAAATVAKKAWAAADWNIDSDKPSGDGAQDATAENFDPFAWIGKASGTYVRLNVSICSRNSQMSSFCS